MRRQFFKYHLDLFNGVGVKDIQFGNLPPDAVFIFVIEQKGIGYPFEFPPDHPGAQVHFFMIEFGDQPFQRGGEGPELGIIKIKSAVSFGILENPVNDL